MPFLATELKGMFPEFFLSKRDVMTPEELAYPKGSNAEKARLARLEALRRQGIDIDKLRRGKGQGEGMANVKGELDRMGSLPEKMDILGTLQKLMKK